MSSEIRRASVRPPPALRPGQDLRSLKRRPGDDYAAAISRARDMPWWHRYASGPYPTSARWVFVIGPEPHGL